MLVMGAEVTNPLQINAIGVVIALLFLTSIVGVLGWMLRLPKETERTRTATRAVRSVNKLANILVPVLSKSPVTDRIVALAVQMAQQRDGHVNIVGVIEVPFTLPLNAKVEEDEKLAREALERAESIAQRCGTGNGTKVGKRSSTRISKRILKARNAGAAIVHEAEDLAVDLILIANSSVRVRGSIQQVDPVVEYVMKNAPCEVLVLSQGRTGTFSNGAGAGRTTESRVPTAGAAR
jgi:nucleotide-binding universal stress UspA family protein